MRKVTQSFSIKRSLLESVINTFLSDLSTHIDLSKYRAMGLNMSFDSDFVDNVLYKVHNRVNLFWLQYDLKDHLMDYLDEEDSSSLASKIVNHVKRIIIKTHKSSDSRS
jgi:hypothetical protein